MKLLTKLSNRQFFRRIIASLLAYVLFLNAFVSVTIAGPEGAQVVNGQVSIQQSGGNTAITASDKAIINYSSFDIARPETVRFIQPGSNASVLNRILSANPTNINGALLANGRVFFVNPAGVYIGDGARINVNQFVASALNISNSDFINGNYNFAGGNGAVINDGDISARQVYLIGKQVTNSGNISCPAGYVVMAAGDRVLLGEPGSDIVLDVEGTPLSEPADAAAPEVGVLNEGTIDAAGGIIALAAAGDIYSQAISNVGSLSTSADTGDAGQIKLAAAGGEVVNTGTIEASGSEGGQVAMEGARVGQFGTIHADGTTGNGGNIDLKASEVVALSPDSITTANAGLNGNGGEIIVYSPGTANFFEGAKIEAKGGSESGDGGFVEVSGKEFMRFGGTVDTTAPNGAIGTLLIDPKNVTIDDSVAATVLGDVDLFEEYPDGASGGDQDAILDVDTLNSANSDVIIQANNNILISNMDTTAKDVSITHPGTSLTLQAGGSITINDNITTNNGQINITANDPAADGAYRDEGNAVITMADGKTINTGNQDIIITMGTGPTPSDSGDITLENLTTTGDILVQNNGPTAGSGILRTSADALLTGSSVVLDVAGAGGGGAIGTSGSPIRVATTNLEARGQSGGIYISSPGSGLTVGGAVLGSLTGISTSGNGSIEVTVDSGDLNISEDISADGSGTVTLDATAAAAELTVAAPVDSDSGLITLEAGGDIALNNGQSVGATTTGGITITADQDNSGAGTLITSNGSSIGNPGTAGDIEITAATLSWHNNTTITGTDGLTLQPSTPGSSIGIAGGTGSFSLSTDDIDNLADGFSSIAIGRSNGLHNITVDEVTFNDPVIIQTPVGGSIAVDGQLTGADNASIDIIGNTYLGADIVTSDNPITISGAATLTANSTLKSGSGAINVDLVTDGGSGYSLSLQDAASTGAVTFAGNVTVEDLITFGGAYAVSLQGASNVIDQDTSFLNTGTTTIGNDATDSSTFTGGLDATEGSVNVAGTVATTNQNMDLGATTLTANSTLKSGSGAINVASVTDGGNGYSLSLQDVASTGAATFAGNVTVEDLITFGGAYAVSLQGSSNVIDQDTSFLNTGTTTIGNDATDSSTFAGGLDAVSAGGVNLAGIVTTTNQNMDLGEANLTANTMLSGSAITFNSTVDGGHSLTVNTGAGTTSFNDAVGSTDALTSLTTDAGGSTELWGNVTTSGAQTYNDDVDLKGGVIARSTGNANITFNKTVDGTQLLDVRTGGITKFADAVGGAETLTSLTTDAGGNTELWGNMTTSGAQTYNDDVDLMADVIARSTGNANITFNKTVDGPRILDVRTGGITKFANAVGGAETLTSLTTDAGGSTELRGNVTTSGAQTYNDNVTVANNRILKAGSSIKVNAGMSGGGTLTLDAGVAVTGSGTIQANAGINPGALTILQSDSLNLDSLSFGNQSNTDLTAQSHNGGFTTDNADDWKSITAAAKNNIELQGTGDIKIGGDLTSTSGGVSIISDNGAVFTTIDNVTITGNSTSGTGVDLPFGSGKAAIMIITKEDLTLGSNVHLKANGQYDSQQNDDRLDVGFDPSLSGGGDPIDVAIYLGSHRTDAVGEPIGHVAVGSMVEIANDGTMVVDAGEKVTFGGKFNESVFNQTHRLEVVSRRSTTLNEVVTYKRLPYADEPESIRNWFTSPGSFTGAYALRGKEFFAEILALINPVPLVAPRPLELEVRNEVEGQDTDALEKLLNELGIGVQPYVTDAYAASLSTDLRLYSAAEKLQQLIPILEDAGGTRIAGLRTAVAQFFPSLDVLSEENMDSFAQELTRHEGDGTDYDLAGQCIFALTEYVNILGKDIGWPVEKSVGFVMGRYVPRLTEGDEIRIAVIQMQLQKALGV